MTKNRIYFCKLVPSLNTIKMIQLIPFPKVQKLPLEIKQIYTDSFPSEERRKWYELEQILQQPLFNLLQVVDNQELTGIISIWNLPDFCFIEHFAIKASSQGKETGSQVIKQVIGTQPTRVILEVDEPITDVAKRRMGFYTRLGFSVCESNYWQPAYSSEKSKVKMRLMSFPDKIQTEEFDQIKKHIYRAVYQLTKPIDFE